MAQSPCKVFRRARQVIQARCVEEFWTQCASFHQFQTVEEVYLPALSPGWLWVHMSWLIWCMSLVKEMGGRRNAFVGFVGFCICWFAYQRQALKTGICCIQERQCLQVPKCLGIKDKENAHCRKLKTQLAKNTRLLGNAARTQPSDSDSQLQSGAHSKML